MYREIDTIHNYNIYLYNKYEIVIYIYMSYNRNSSALILAISCLIKRIFFSVFLSFDKVSRNYSLRRSVPNFLCVAHSLKKKKLISVVETTCAAQFILKRFSVILR